MKSRMFILCCVLAALACSRTQTTETSATASTTSSTSTPTVTVAPDNSFSTAPATGSSETVATSAIETVGINPNAVTTTTVTRRTSVLVPTAGVSAGSNAALVTTGQALFRMECVACHGLDASGRTPMGNRYAIPDLRSQTLQTKSDEELKKILLAGLGPASAAAHRSKHLTADQTTALIAYIRSLR